MPILLSPLARVATLMVLASPVLAAQTPLPPKPLCFVPDVASHCRRFVLLEGNMAFRQAASSVATLGQYPEQNRVNGSLAWGLGAMQNVSDRTAVGGAVAYGYNGPSGSRTTVEFRAMRWLPGRMALEGSAGFLQLNGYQGAANGVTAGAALTYRDLIGVTANVQSIGQQSAVLIGVRTGSWVTPIATAALFGTIAVALANARWD
jgi:hypothetical protein